MSKTDLDLILFAALQKYSDQKFQTDHALSKYLQITQQRVRNLKEKTSVKYIITDREDAINDFTEKIKNAKITDEYIDVPIFEIAVKNEIESILDEQKIVLHSQLNPKIFRLRVDDFLELMILIDVKNGESSDRDKKYESLIKSIKAKVTKDEDLLKDLGLSRDDLNRLNQNSLKKALVHGGIATSVNLLASLVPGASFFSEPIKTIFIELSSRIMKV
ncbi:MAG: hypothetical protein JXR70_10720 [Spirochaetales bacterium]|nr:hypothetical protein [Spirochaetales bacterium]